MKYIYKVIQIFLLLIVFIFNSCEYRPTAELYGPDFVFDGPWQVNFIGYDVAAGSELFFVNENTGWMFTDPFYSLSQNENWTGLLKTTDGGFSWSIAPLTFQTQFQAYQYNIGNTEYFLDENTGWVLSAQNELYRMSYGTNWQLINSGDQWKNGNGVLEIYFSDINNGWLVSDKSIYKSSNGGYSWTLQYEISSGSSELFRQAHFYNENMGWAMSSHHTIDTTFTTLLNTQDGGQNWNIISKLDTSIYGVVARDMVFTDDQTGWIIFGSNFNFQITSIYKTVNGGITWSPVTSPLIEIFKMVFVNNNVGWIIDFGSIYKTKDGGNSWTQQNYTPIHSGLNDIFFIDEDNGWVSGDGAILLKTTTGGE